MRRVLSIVTLALIGAVVTAVQSGYLPPPGALQEVYHRGVRYLQGRWNGISYSVVAEPKTIDLDDVTLLSLVYEPNEIPGMPAASPILDNLVDPYRHHTRLTITDRYGEVQRGYCTTASLEVVTDSHDRTYRRFQEIAMIEVCAYITPEEARTSAFGRYGNTSRPGGTYQHLGKLLAMSRLGEVHWTRSLSPGRYDIAFVVGRVTVNLEWHRRRESANREQAEAMAWGVLYRLLHHPRLLAGKFPAAQPDGTADLNGVKVAPLNRTKASGVRIESNRTDDNWRVRVQWGQRWVELETFSWQMKTWDGRQVQLSRPAFPYRGDLVAPLQEVKQALGME